METKVYPKCKFFSGTRTLWKGRKKVKMNCAEEYLNK